MICNPLLKDSCNQVSNPQGYIDSVIQAVLTTLFIVAVIYFVWHFIYAGYHYIQAQGDSKKLEDAKTEVTSAFIGLIIVFSVFAILKLAGTILGVDGLENLQITLPSL